MDNNQNQNTAQTPPQASQQPVNPPPADSNQHGMSNDTKTLIVILLLIFTYWIGLIFMWIWMKTWPKWIKILVTLPAIIFLIVVPLAIIVSITDPFGQQEKGANLFAKVTAQEFVDATNRYVSKVGKVPCDFNQFNDTTLNNAQECISSLVAERELKESFSSVKELSSITILYDSMTNKLSLCYSSSDDCVETTLLTSTPSPFDQNGTPSPTASPSAVQSVIESALTSETYTDLVPYMAESVMFEIEASEGVGPGTPEETVTNLAYLDTAAAPWDFDQTNPIITSIKTQYAQEYGNLFIGISSNDVMSAFGFDQNNKINIIKVAVTYKLLVNE